MSADAIAKAMLGVGEFVPIDGKAFAWRVNLKAAVAAFQDGFGGTIRFEDIKVPTQYRLVAIVEGQQSLIDSSILITLQEEAGQTLLIWDAEANISGELARVSQRAIKLAATLLSSRYFQSIEDQLSEETPSA